MIHAKKMIYSLLIIMTVSCSTTKPTRMEKVLPPAVMDDEFYNPFIHGAVVQNRNRLPILYATNRIPSSEEDKELYYQSRRSNVVRLGIAGVGLSNEGKTWDDLTLIEESRAKGYKASLEVIDVEEFGILDSSTSPFDDVEIRENEGNLAESRFLTELKSQLNQTKSKDVVIFVHGYNQNFESPILMSAQLWHYLGYRGSFISYGWPATSKNTAYLKDLDTAAISSRSFRIFLDFLAEQEEIEKIHILGYSAGTRLVTQTLYQKALQLEDIPSNEAQLITKLGTVLLSNSDMDRAIFASYLLDGQLNILNRLNLYTSSKDMVLFGSQTLHMAPRMGQTINEEDISDSLDMYLRINEKLKLIDVSNAEQITSGGGHYYFLRSPWVSSDVLFTLLTSFDPKDRGLVPHETLPIWVFPPDYVERNRSIMHQLSSNMFSETP